MFAHLSLLLALLLLQQASVFLLRNPLDVLLNVKQVFCSGLYVLGLVLLDQLLHYGVDLLCQVGQVIGQVHFFL